MSRVRYTWANRGKENAENAKRVKCTPMTCKDILNFINEKEKSIEFGAKSAGFRLVQI